MNPASTGGPELTHSSNGGSGGGAPSVTTAAGRPCSPNVPSSEIDVSPLVRRRAATVAIRRPARNTSTSISHDPTLPGSR